jgi:hypothetical protein
LYGKWKGVWLGNENWAEISQTSPNPNEEELKTYETFFFLFWLYKCIKADQLVGGWGAIQLLLRDV